MLKYGPREGERAGYLQGHITASDNAVKSSSKYFQQSQFYWIENVIDLNRLA